MLFSWIVFPAVLGVVSLGCGLIVEQAAGVRLRGVLLLPTGFAVVVVVAQLATMSSRTAQFATPAVVALAIGGLALSAPWSGRRIDGWPTAAAVGVFLIFAAPIVLSGAATIAGWIKLDDTATWLALTDRVMQHGLSVAGLPHSTYELTVAVNLAVGYPVGAFVPLGVGGQLVRQDIAWLVQPYKAFLAAMLALAIYSLASRAIGRRPSAPRRLRRGPGSSLRLRVVGRDQGGGGCGVDRVGRRTRSLPARSKCIPPHGDPARRRNGRDLRRADRGRRDLAGADPFPAVWLVFRGRGARFTLVATAVFVLVTAALAIPTIATTRAFSNSASFVTQSTDLGNLIRPLKFIQVFGIWPAGDFRVESSRPRPDVRPHRSRSVGWRGRFAPSRASARAGAGVLRRLRASRLGRPDGDRVALDRRQGVGDRRALRSPRSPPWAEAHWLRAVGAWKGSSCCWRLPVAYSGRTHSSTTT